jgi:NADPH:quinone reductase-like Zn-dependent oxidoreductase
MQVSEQAYRVQMARVGVLEDLQLQPVSRREPEPGEVEIEVRALGLNLREVLKALDFYAGHEVAKIVDGDPSSSLTFDGDCAGTVVAVGPDVTRLRVGDEVMGMGNDVFGSFAILPASYLVRKPAHLSFTEAVTIPVVFLTVWHALRTQARMQPGESVLIHSAAGGVGLAAVQLSQFIGAEIFATAGSEEKHEFLRGLGIEHVMSSRNYDFVEEILKVTGGRGVDVVLNALAGEFIPKSISVLAPFGRFLEIGKRDIYGDSQLGLYPFRRNLSFFGIDLLQMEAGKIETLFAEVMQYFEGGELRPLHHSVFHISEVAKAFRHMRRANHIGKIVISLGD